MMSFGINAIPVALAAVVSFGEPAAMHAEEQNSSISVEGCTRGRLIVRLGQRISGEGGYTRKVEITVPCAETVVSADKILAYNSATEFNNGDSSYQRSPPRFGYLLFGTDSRGPTVDVRLVDLVDKRQFASSTINGLYHFAYPPK